MSINLQGHILNQRQLDAIVPVMNDLMQGKVSKRGFEKACVKALEEAGCPLGYDTGLPGAETSIETRARRWIVDGQVGMSSKAIWSHMMGEPSPDMPDPRDPDDLNRCLLLLDLIPEWAPRMGEMAQYGASWAGLVARWSEIAEAFLSEAGLNWCHDRPAPHTYALMKAARGGGVMTATSQDEFEQSYSEYTGHPVEFIKLHRLSNGSYSSPRIATAYTWWKRAREAVPA